MFVRDSVKSKFHTEKRERQRFSYLFEPQKATWGIVGGEENDRTEIK